MWGIFYYPLFHGSYRNFSAEEKPLSRKPIGQPLFHHHPVEVDLKWSGGTTFTRFVLNLMTAALRKIHPDLWKKGESMKRWIHLEAKVDTLRVVHSHPWSKGWWWSTSPLLTCYKDLVLWFVVQQRGCQLPLDWSFSFQVGVFLSMAPGQSFPIGISPLRRHFSSVMWQSYCFLVGGG